MRRCVEFSIIIPVYNTENYIQKCVSSILSQEGNADYEIILVDDGSTDSSGKLCEIIASEYDNCYVVHQENMGVSSARNVGLSLSTGKWALFVDSDDLLLPGSLAYICESIKEDIDFFIAGYIVTDQTGSVIYSIDDRVKTILDQNMGIKLMYQPLFYRYLGNICSKLYRLDIIHNNGIQFDNNIFYNEDRLFAVQYICHCQKILFDTTPLYQYVERSNSAMCSLRESFSYKFVTDFDAFVLMFDIVRVKTTNSSIRKIAAKSIYNSFLHQISRMKLFKMSDEKLVRYFVYTMLHKIPCVFVISSFQRFRLFLKRRFSSLFILPKC